MNILWRNNFSFTFRDNNSQPIVEVIMANIEIMQRDGQISRRWFYLKSWSIGRSKTAELKIPQTHFFNGTWLRARKNHCNVRRFTDNENGRLKKWQPWITAVFISVARAEGELKKYKFAIIFAARPHKYGFGLQRYIWCGHASQSDEKRHLKLNLIEMPANDFWATRLTSTWGKRAVFCRVCDSSSFEGVTNFVCPLDSSDFRTGGPK